MEKLLDYAKKFLEENPNLNEVELSDGIYSVTVVRISPVVLYDYPYELYPGVSFSISEIQ